MDISFQSNIREWTRDFHDVAQRQVPFATSLALNQTASDVRAAHYDLLPRIFDRPNRFTMRSLYYRATHKRDRDMVATVAFKDSNRFSRHYLMPQVEGGSRPHKRFEQWLINRGIMRDDEFAVPGKGVKLDASGNMSPGTITQILSQLFASPDAHQWETARSRKRAGASRPRYFAPSQGSKLRRGIWRRQGNTLAPVLIFVSGVTYQVRYRFEEISAREASMRFPINFAFALERALATDRGY